MPLWQEINLKEVSVGTRSIVVLIGLLLNTLVFSQVVSASCNPGRPAVNGHWQDGWKRSKPSGACLTGSSSNIRVYSPYVHTNDVSAWVMLYNANPNSDSYAQVGWLQQANGSRFNFVESITVGGGFRQTYFSANSVGSTPEYKITFSSDAFHYFVNGVNWYTHANTGYGGCWSAQAGEISSFANQMPGGRNSHVPFTNASVRRSDTGWVGANGTPYSNSSEHGNAIGSSTTLHIWDKACTN